VKNRRSGRTAFFLALIVSCFFRNAAAQDFFAGTYGGSGYDYAYSMEATSDGGYVFCGPGTLGAGLWDFWIVKLDGAGNVSWQKAYGGASDDIPNSIKQTGDGGYIVAGRTQSFGVSGGMDAWVLKLDQNGDRVWQKTFGGSGDYDAAYSVVQNPEGGYYLAGWTNSYGSGSYDFWVIKLDPAGNSLWQRALGGSSYDCAYSCCLASDGGVVVAGGASVGAGGYDVWIYKLDSSGNKVWQKAFGGAGDDMALCVRQTSDEGYVVAGFTKSYGSGSQDFWVLRIDSSGGLVWQKTYGGTAVDWAFGVVQTADGGYIVVGRTDSFGTGTDAWILKLDSAGGIEWERNFGGTGFEYAYCVCLAADGSCLVGGITGSFGAGSYDAIILRLQSPCFSGGSCPYLAATAVTPGSPSPTVTVTTKNPVSTSCTSYTTAPTATNPAASKAVQCVYPLLPGGDALTLSLTKSGDNPVMEWNAPVGSCPATGYGVYRGTLPIVSYDHASLNCGVTDLFFTDFFSGSANYYLVVPNNAYLEGSYGYSFDGTGYSEIPAGTSPCRVRCPVECH